MAIATAGRLGMLVPGERPFTTGKAQRQVIIAPFQPEKYS